MDEIYYYSDLLDKEFTIQEKIIAAILLIGAGLSLTIKNDYGLLPFLVFAGLFIVLNITISKRAAKRMGKTNTEIVEELNRPIDASTFEYTIKNGRFEVFTL